MSWLVFILGACDHSRIAGTPAQCGACHTELTTSWTTSMHGRAHEDPLFREAFHRAQDPWCLTCHRPTGVTCQACHEEGRTCADCHQFDLPGTGLASQDTAEEHARSSFAATPCTGCHDPHTTSNGGHDEPGVRRALTVEATATADGTRIVLRTEGVGHAFPTGDPFRRLVIEVCEDRACSRPVDARVLERSLRETPAGWVVRADTRIPPATVGSTSEVELNLAAGRGWRLTYRYADPRHGDLGGAASMFVDAGLVAPVPLSR